VRVDARLGDRPIEPATMREILPFAAVDRAAMIDLPPFDA
jgi:hypothetical protein